MMRVPRPSLGSAIAKIGSRVLSPYLKMLVLRNPEKGHFWRDIINKSAKGDEGSFSKNWEAWITDPESSFNGVPDASFDNKEARPVGKLIGNEAFLKMQALMGNGTKTISSEEGPGRPFYVSNLFF